MKRIILLIFISKYLLSAAFGQVTIDSAVNFSGLTPYGETLELYSYLDDGKIVMLEFFRPT